MTFKQSLVTCLSNYFNFKGRASKWEFLWFEIFVISLVIIADFIDSTETISDIILILLFIPLIAVGSRRLHDMNKSGWWQLLILTVIGLIPLYYWWSREGSNQDNRFGSFNGNS